MAQRNRFRTIMYSSSARTFATGDLIALNIMKSPLQAFRSPALGVAKLMGDLQSIRPGGQGLNMRVQRRVSGRVAGRLGHILIPQGMGFASRLMNKYYGKYLTKSLNNFFNEKVQYSVKLDGSKMTETTVKSLSKNLRKTTGGQLKKASGDLKSMGVNIEHFNPAAVLRKIQLQMLGSTGSGGAAPIQSGRLVSSINLRGFKRSSEALIEGYLTIGGSGSSPIGGPADDAPYWWKTVYGGWYDFSGPERFIPAKNPSWFGKSVSYGVKRSLPKGSSYEVDNGAKVTQQNTSGDLLYLLHQPPRPTGPDRWDGELGINNTYPPKDDT
tara:strand:+ start:16213 stop:17190 length:978 start_codon:yes stop_codon:yes gene_type:complete